MRQRASILIGLLWCVAILSIVVIGVLHTATLDLRVGKNYGDTIQAHYLALAGIEKAKALLFLEARDRKTSEKNHVGTLYNSPSDFREIPLGRGSFSVIRAGDETDAEAMVFGVADEESRLNVNRASAEEIAKLPGLTPQMAAAIVDYRDTDNNVSTGGAEAEDYAAQLPPYLPRNGPFRTVGELRMVLGLDRELFLGEDANQNGLLDTNEKDGDRSQPVDNRDAVLDAGWSGRISVTSSVRNAAANGETRVNVQQADETALAAVPGFSTDIARAIVQSRGQNQIESLADLLDVRAGGGNNNQRQGAGQRGRGGAPPEINLSGGPTGGPVISEELLLNAADRLTTQSESSLAGAVNINTASADVLACLPGMSPELAGAVVNYRQSSGFFENIAWLLRVPGMTRDLFKQVGGRVTARSETFRIVGEGRVTSTGARKRVEMIVRIGNSFIDTLSYREDL